MVNFHDMMSQRVSTMRVIGLERARQRFRELGAFDDPSPDSINKLVLDREKFVILLTELLEKSLKESTRGKSLRRLGAKKITPPKRDLYKAFILADAVSLHDNRDVARNDLST